MCNPNLNGADALNQIVTLLQKVAMNTSTMSSAMTKQPLINSAGSESNGMLQKILEAIEKNSMKMNDRLDALEKNVEERFEVMERKMDDLSISSAMSHCKIDEIIENDGVLRFELHQKLAENQRKTVEEFENLRKIHEETERNIQATLEKVSSMMTKITLEQNIPDKTEVERLNEKVEEHQKTLSEVVKENTVDNQANGSTISTTSDEPTDMECSNCHSNKTTSWRRDVDGNLLCNPCGLYLRLHKVNRPMTRKNEEMKTWRRRMARQESI